MIRHDKWYYYRRIDRCRDLRGERFDPPVHLWLLRNERCRKEIKVQDKNASDYPYYAVIGVDGMKCKHCKLHVENAFNEKDGNWAEVNLEKKEADVRMKTKLTDREIRDIVSKAGYVLRNIEWKQA